MGDIAEGTVEVDYEGNGYGLQIIC